MGKLEATAVVSVAGRAVWPTSHQLETRRVSFWAWLCLCLRLGHRPLFGDFRTLGYALRRLGRPVIHRTNTIPSDISENTTLVLRTR